MPLVQCKQCGSDVSQHAVQCPRCGADCTIEIPPSSHTCLECDSEYVVAVETNACPNCGNPHLRTDGYYFGGHSDISIRILDESRLRYIWGNTQAARDLGPLFTHTSNSQTRKETTYTQTGAVITFTIEKGTSEGGSFSYRGTVVPDGIEVQSQYSGHYTLGNVGPGRPRSIFLKFRRCRWQRERAAHTYNS